MKDWEFTNGTLQLIFQREWHDWIVDLVNHLAKKVPELDEDESYAHAYDACKKVLEDYLHSKSN